MLTRSQLRRAASLALAALAGCGGEVRQAPGPGGAGGASPDAATGAGAGGAGAGWTEGDVPEGSWGPASFIATCRVEVTRGANPDVPRFAWEPCPAPFACTRWSGADRPEAPHAFSHVTRVVAAAGRTLLGTTLGNLPGEKSVVTGVWDAASGDLLIAWRTLDPACSVVAFPADGERVWVSVQEMDQGVAKATHVEHQLGGGGHRVLDPATGGIAGDGDARFLLAGDGGPSLVWDAAAARWLEVAPGSTSARLHPGGLSLISSAGDLWTWAPDRGARRLARPALGAVLTSATASDAEVFWHSVRRPPDDEPPAPRGGEPPGGGEPREPEEPPTTEVRRAPLSSSGEVPGEVLLTVPFEGDGRASRSRYVLVEPYSDARVHVVDLATSAVSIVELPPDMRSKSVLFVGDDGGGDEVVWLATDGLGLARLLLP